MFEFLQQLMSQGGAQGAAGGGNFLDMFNFGRQQNSGMPSNMKILSGNPNDPEMQNFLNISPDAYAQLLQKNNVPTGSPNLSEYLNKPYSPLNNPTSNPMMANNNQMQQQMLMQMLSSRQPQQEQQAAPPVGAAPMPSIPTRFASNNRPDGNMSAQAGMPAPMGMQPPIQVMSPTRRRIIGNSLV